MRQLNQGLQMSQQTIGQTFDGQVSLNPSITVPACDRNWYAVYTVPQHEKSVVKHLDLREIESFLPVYETVRVWKNRQRMKLILPLFPTYLFVHITFRERVKVLQSPGVLQIVGSKRECAYLSDSEVELLRSGCSRQKIEPYRDLVIGERVRIKSGVMQGLQGTLVRKCNSLRFVLTIELINQHAAIQVDAEDLEQIVA
jgi:transcription antitermination factor NusG